VSLDVFFFSTCCRASPAHTHQHRVVQSNPSEQQQQQQQQQPAAMRALILLAAGCISASLSRHLLSRLRFLLSFRLFL
jgi:hypothetical protein